MGQQDETIRIIFIILLVLLIIWLIWWLINSDDDCDDNLQNSKLEHSNDKSSNKAVVLGDKYKFSKLQKITQKVPVHQEFSVRPYKRLSDAKTGLHDRSDFAAPEHFVGSSNNWSGYVAAQNLKSPPVGSCTNVSGTFNIPTIDSKVTSQNNNVSAWVGIDGAFDSNPTVQQIGVDLSYNNGKPEIYCWYEMYPDYAYEIQNFPANSGDSISVIVDKVGSGANEQYDMTIVNNTKNVKTTIKGKKGANTKNQSVEWIVEAPALGNNIVPLTSFSPITWTNCKATVGGKQVTIKDLQNEPINMVTTRGDIKAKTSNLTQNGQGFTVTWQHQ